VLLTKSYLWRTRHQLASTLKSVLTGITGITITIITEGTIRKAPRFVRIDLRMESDIIITTIDTIAVIITMNRQVHLHLLRLL
jgi:hypothetical protein